MDRSQSGFTTFSAIGGDSSQNLGRRKFLVAGVATLVLSLSREAQAATSSSDRSLAFFNTHTGERLNATYWRRGAYDPGALKDIDYILRDFRTGDIHPIDRRLLHVLSDLHWKAGSRKAFQIISGYRSPKTNRVLAAANEGVAKRSLHMEAKAIDIRLADIRLSDLRQDAIALKAGGVGYYPHSGFIHVDTGRVRQW